MEANLNLTRYAMFELEDQMLVELKIVEDPERVGFYSGLIVSSYPFILSLCSIAEPGCEGIHIQRNVALD